MEQDLQELIRDARKKVLKASGIPLTEEDENEERRKAALEKLQGFMLRQLGINAAMLLNVKAVWTEKGPTVNLDTEGHVFRVRQDDGNGYILLVLDSGGEREIARIEASDPIFASRVLVAIDDAVSKG
jgi:hypothetical protein